MPNTPGLKTRTVTIPVADGTQLSAFVALPEHKSELPGIMVFPEIFGINNHIKDLTRRLAQAGYLAIAPEMFHRTAPGFHASYDDMPSGFAQAKQMLVPQIECDILALQTFLNADPHVKQDTFGAIGFCMGGRLAFLANSVVPLRAAVSFYGSGIPTQLRDRFGRQHGPLLTAWGGRDSHIPLSQAREVEDLLLEAGKPHTNVIFHEAEHGFLCDERSSFHRPSAEQAWALATAFLNTNLHS